MLTIYDLDENTQTLKTKCPALAQQLYVLFLSDATFVKHATDITGLYADSVLLVTRGVFKMFYNDKFIRFYKVGDIFCTPANGADTSIKIVSEMASEIKMMQSGQFITVVNASPEKSSAWFEYSQIQYQLMTGICAALINNDKAYDINLKTFYSGDHIITEDEFPDCLYEMVDGTATVLVKGTEIGQVNPSEIFGEVSFLTGLNRTASVVAKTTCLVQCIDGQFFSSLIRQRPAMVQKMAKTIAYRLSEVNDKLIRIKTLT